jgi:hypothetical protein
MARGIYLFIITINIRIVNVTELDRGVYNGSSNANAKNT